jgi:molecular chaperone GrpE
MKTNKEQHNNHEETDVDETSPELEKNAENTDSANTLSETEIITKLTGELDLQKDKYVRLFAEFDNFKRRNAKERVELIQTAGKEVITSMLDVLDDCDRAEKQISATENADIIKEGIQLVFNKLRTTLQAKGLKAMESINSDFDVEKHEAIAEVPVDDENKKGKVIDEIVKGYYLNDKLIRFAKVIVGK